MSVTDRGAKLVLGSAYAAGPMVVFLKTDQNGKPIFDGQGKTAGALTVFHNSTDQAGNTYTNKYDLRVVGEKMLSIMSLVTTGKEMALEAYASSWEEPTGKSTKDGKAITKTMYGFTLSSVRFLADSVKYMAAVLTDYFNGRAAMGLLPPGINHEDLANGAAKALRTKNKAKSFNMAEAVATGKFGNASIWTEEKGTWKAQGQQNGVPNIGNAANMTPEMLKKLLLDALAVQNAQSTPVQTPPENTPPAQPQNAEASVGDDVWNSNDIPF